MQKGCSCMSSVCIITARGGSKRIPRKNIRLFLGSPIISYSIKAAIESDLFEEVMVSTDDEEIASIAKSCGASVPFMRSSENSGDRATTYDVLAEVLGEYSARGRRFDTLCCIYPTAPFVTAKKLRIAAAMLDGADTVLSVVRFSFPPQRGLVGSNDNLSYWQPEYAAARSQDLEPVFHDAGQFYFCRIPALLSSGLIVGARTRGIEVSELEAQDIDNISDWEIAEIKYRRMIAHGEDQG